MKIGVLTWYKSINHGAVLQAYALQETLKNKFACNVAMLDYERNVKVMDNNLTKLKSKLSYFNIYNLIIKKNIKVWNTQKKTKFEKFKNEYINIGKKYDVENNLDAVAIGSDMVFDFYEGYNPYMYGKNVKSNYIFSYAACFGYTTDELFENFSKKEEIKELISKLNGVSYRDNNTGKLLADKCSIKNGTKVIDPVLLYGFDKEKKEWNSHNWESKNYLLIYSYQSNMNSYKEVREIKKFAKENKLEIVSVGYNHPWCDYSINADPKEFVELFNNAKFILTDTFHGTIFSLIFNKQFCVTIRNNAFKVLDVLDEVDIKVDLNKGIYERLSCIKSTPLDYNEINKKVEKLRKISYNYLEKQIEGAKTHYDKK